MVAQSEARLDDVNVDLDEAFRALSRKRPRDGCASAQSYRDGSYRTSVLSRGDFYSILTLIRDPSDLGHVIWAQPLEGVASVRPYWSFISPGGCLGIMRVRS